MPTPEDFLECRATYHPWETLGLKRMDGPHVVWRWVEESRCPRCTTTRYSATDVHGKTYHRYRHPADYKYAKNEMPTKAEFKLLRLENMWRNREEREATVAREPSET